LKEYIDKLRKRDIPVEIYYINLENNMIEKGKDDSLKFRPYPVLLRQLSYKTLTNFF
jgi:hypothetical protein